MIHDIVLPAVLKKSRTKPHDKIIGNTEMAVCIAYILSDAGIDKEVIKEFGSPEELLEKYKNVIIDIDINNVSEESVNMMDMIKEYKVLPMVNEKIEDLNILIDIVYSNITKWGILWVMTRTNLWLTVICLVH